MLNGIENPRAVFPPAPGGGDPLVCFFVTVFRSSLITKGNLLGQKSKLMWEGKCIFEKRKKFSHANCLCLLKSYASSSRLAMLLCNINLDFLDGDHQMPAQSPLCIAH